MAPVANIPGLMQATFKGGYNLSVWKADASTGDAVEVMIQALKEKLAHPATIFIQD